MPMTWLIRTLMAVILTVQPFPLLSYTRFVIKNMISNPMNCGSISTSMINSQPWSATTISRQISSSDKTPITFCNYPTLRSLVPTYLARLLGLETTRPQALRRSASSQMRGAHNLQGKLWTRAPGSALLPLEPLRISKSP